MVRHCISKNENIRHSGEAELGNNLAELYMNWVCVVLIEKMPNVVSYSDSYTQLRTFLAICKLK